MSARRSLYRAYAALRARPLLGTLADLSASQWLGPADIEALQLGRLQEILGHAGRTVPYYRELFARERFNWEDVSSLADLGRLPVLTRELLVARFDDLQSERPGPGIQVRATGGSTGRPIRFLVDRDEMTRRSALIYRGQRWLGWDLGDRSAFVWGSDIDSREHKGGLGAWRDAFAGVLWLDAFRLEEKALDASLDRLEQFDAGIVIGYPSSLHLLALRAIQVGRTVKLRGIESSAEVLTPRVRNDLIQAFACTVLDRYGCREAGVVAHECDRGGLHINAENVALESEGGELLLTTLNNRSMPLIRYRNEDRGSLSSSACPCGRGLPLMGSVEGRVSDIIRTPGGRLVHGEFFTHLFYGSAAVRQFQVRQSALNQLEVMVVCPGGLPDAEKRRLKSAILDHADPDFQIEIRCVTEIPVGLSGKFRFTISDLGPLAPSSS